MISNIFAKKAYGEFRGSISSTLAALPNAAAVARHKHHWRKSSDTLLSFEVIMISGLICFKIFNFYIGIIIFSTTMKV